MHKKMIKRGFRDKLGILREDLMKKMSGLECIISFILVSKISLRFNGKKESKDWRWHKVFNYFTSFMIENLRFNKSKPK